MDLQSLEQLGLQTMSLNEDFKSKANKMIFIGSKLSAIWQVASSVEWQLFNNILTTFNIEPTDVIFFDTDLLTTEEAQFLIVDEIIAMGVETIYCFGENNKLAEQLQEGLAIVFLPTLTSQLNNWQDKKSMLALMLS